jgi:hypothetical protein
MKPFRVHVTYLNEGTETTIDRWLRGDHLTIFRNENAPTVIRLELYSGKMVYFALGGCIKHCTVKEEGKLILEYHQASEEFIWDKESCHLAMLCVDGTHFCAANGRPDYVKPKEVENGVPGVF